MLPLASRARRPYFCRVSGVATGMMNPHGHDLDARARRLLRTLIAHYLVDGEPVGSRTLSRSSGLDVSPATIRNIMADLEDAGLVASPHTSAGRVPTPRGLRLFVDSLIELQPLPRAEMARLQSELPPGPTTTRDLLGNISTLLSAMTRFAGVVTVPRQADFPLRHIDFVALPDARVLVILVFTDNQVQNRIVQLARPLANRELEQAANYLNSHFAGLRVDDIRAHLLAEVRETGSELNRLLASTMELATASFAPQAGSGSADVLVSGQTNLMAYAELADLQRLRELFDAFQQKNEWLQRGDGQLRRARAHAGCRRRDRPDPDGLRTGDSSRTGDGRIAQRRLESRRDDPITGSRGGFWVNWMAGRRACRRLSLGVMHAQQRRSVAR